MEYKIISNNYFNKKGEKLLTKNNRLNTKLKVCLKTLSENPLHLSLRLHKLENTNYYSISLTMKIRILIRMNGNNIFLMDIGSHDDVY